MFISAESHNLKELYYFSRHLKARLAGIETYPLTVVEAPSGFGKTTAVREYLKNTPCAYWYHCLGEPPVKAWEGICELFERFDANTARGLKKLMPPAGDALADMVSVLRKLNCREKTFLVIDNYQLVSSYILRETITAFAMHGNANLHIIFITQQLQSEQKSEVHHGQIHTIGSSDLLFDRECIADYFRMAGIRLNGSQLDHIQNSTEGWIAAIRLQMLNYQQTGTFEHTCDIEQLVKTTVWNRLSSQEKEFMLSVSVLDGFTGKQARIMLGMETLPANITNLLENNAFIRYLPEKDLYTMHSILQNYLRNRFYNSQPEKFQTEVLRRAGESCVAISDYYPAMVFFRQVRDFEAILALPLRENYLYYQDERLIIEIIAWVAMECPSEILRQYPKSVVTFAFQLFFFGQCQPFGYLCEVIGTMLANDGVLSEESRQKLAGEMEFIKSFIAYNDIEKMSFHHQAAYELLGGPSEYIFVDAPWTFGAVSVLYMFWHKAGKLEREARLLEECLPYYIKLARGHGTGADIVLRAEIMFARGNDADAELLCHKAIYLARSKRQLSLCLCAELILARIAVLRGDGESYISTVDSIKGYAAGNPDWQTVRMVDLCLASLSLALGEKEIPDWLSDMETARKNLFSAAIPYCHILYGRLLLNNKNYSKLGGISGLMIGEAEVLSSLLPQLYHLIHLALAWYGQGDMPKAQETLSRALSLSLPDKVYMPLAEHGAELIPLLERAKLSLSIADREGAGNIIELAKRQEAGLEAVRKKIVTNQSPLTPREREIALLAKERLSAKAIANTLFITESTVRSALKIIYGKLDVHSKAELAEMDF